MEANMQCVPTSGTSGWWWMLALPAAPLSLPFEGVAVLTIFAVSTVLVAWMAASGPAWYGWRMNMKGPRGVPMLGSMMAMKGLAHRNLAALARRFGGGQLMEMMAFSVGSTRTVVCFNADVGKELLNSPAFADRPVNETARLLMFERAMGFAPSGEYWRHLRRLAANHLFSPRRILAAEPLRRRVSSSLLSQIHVNNNVHVRIRGTLQAISLRHMMGCLYGRTLKSDGKESEEVRKMVKEGYDLLGIFNYSDHLPMLSFLDIQGVRKRCNALLPKVRAFLSSVIEEHKASPPSSDSDFDFVDVLLSLQGTEKLAEEDMVALLWEMVFRGSDTVAIVVEWILARLVLHQDIQSNVHKEMQKIVDGSRGVMEKDIERMEYMKAVVKEVLRVHPPGPLLSWARLAIHDVHVGGHFIPAGTTAMVNLWAITHDERVWKDADKFDPTRFLSTDGDVVKDVLGSDMRLAPFGSGKRVCPGRALGLHTVHVLLARMLWHFKWLPSPTHPVDFSELMKLSCEMKYPLHAKPVRRNTVPLEY